MNACEHKATQLKVKLYKESFVSLLTLFVTRHFTTGDMKAYAKVREKCNAH